MVKTKMIKQYKATNIKYLHYNMWLSSYHTLKSLNTWSPSTGQCKKFSVAGHRYHWRVYSIGQGPQMRRPFFQWQFCEPSWDQVPGRGLYTMTELYKLWESSNRRGGPIGIRSQIIKPFAGLTPTPIPIPWIKPCLEDTISNFVLPALWTGPRDKW